MIIFELIWLLIGAMLALASTVAIVRDCQAKQRAAREKRLRAIVDEDLESWARSIGSTARQKEEQAQHWARLQSEAQLAELKFQMHELLGDSEACRGLFHALDMHQAVGEQQAPRSASQEDLIT